MEEHPHKPGRKYAGSINLSMDQTRRCFPDTSGGYESASNAGDPSSIPESGSYPGEGNYWSGYPIQYSWASLVAQTVKNLPAMRETLVQPLGWKDPLEEGMATHPKYSCLENPHGQRSLVGYSPWGCKESDMTE